MMLLLLRFIIFVSVNIIITVRMLIIFGQEAVLGGNRASLRGPLLHGSFAAVGLGFRL